MELESGQKQHKHIGIFWADHHCVITILHVAVDEWQPPLGSCITPALPLFCLQKSSSISLHRGHIALFYSAELSGRTAQFVIPRPYQACFVLHLAQELLPLLNQLWGGYAHYLHSRRSWSCCYLSLQVRPWPSRGDTRLPNAIWVLSTLTFCTRAIPSTANRSWRVWWPLS